MKKIQFEKAAEKANLFVKWETESIFTYHTSKKRDKPLMAGYYVKNNVAMSLDETKSIYQSLLDFFKNDAHHFMILAMGGFENDAFELEQFNLKLVDSNYVKELKEMGNSYIEMLPHNQRAFNRIMVQLKESQKTAVVQATGTGKSFLACKTIQALGFKSNLIVAPSHYILNQFKKIASLNNVSYITYQGLSKMSQRQMSQYDFIVLDEFHRIGAEKWGSGIDRLLIKNPTAKVLGLSATPVRYLDNERDMSKELFDGNVAESLSLEEAIAKNILPKPVYVSAIYDIADYVKEKIDFVKKSRISKVEKNNLVEEIDLVRRNWEKSLGIPSVLSNHVDESASKFIVFIESVKELDEMQALVSNWFSSAFKEKKIKSFFIYSDQPSNVNDKALSDFDKADKNSIHLLFSINMLNEGLHVKDTSGVILMRKTVSPTIYFQQIGRALQSHFNSTPYIFDFVNNFKNVNVRYLAEKIDNEALKYEKLLKDYEINYKLEPFKINDLTLEAQNLFESIEERIGSGWDGMFQLYKEYVKDKEDRNVHYDYIYKDQKLGNWVAAQRSLKKRGLLIKEREDLLNEEGFIWDRMEDLWDQSFQLLKKLYDENGGPMLFIPAEFDKSHGGVCLSSWCRTQKKIYKEGRLPEDRIEKLSSIGFCFDEAYVIYDKLWLEMFDLLVDFKKETGHTKVPTEYTVNGKDLGGWVSRQRILKRNGNLNKRYVERLESIDFTWDLLDEIWEDNYKILCEFKKEFNTLKIPVDYVVNGMNLASWCGSQRTKYKKGTLSEDKVNKLKAIDFKFDVAAEVWEENFNAYCEFVGDDPMKTISSDQMVNGVNIDSWSQMQRYLYRKNKLSQDKVDRLNAISFPWDKKEALWQKGFNQLKMYVEDGNTLDKVPKTYKGFNLNSWVCNQHRTFKECKISEQRIEKLESINFQFK